MMTKLFASVVFLLAGYTTLAAEELAFTKPLTAADTQTLSSFSGSTVKIDAGLSDELAADGSTDWIDSLPTGLVHLRIRNTSISNALFVKIVARQPALQILNLPTCQFDLATFKKIEKLKKIRQLRLGGDSIDDQMLAVLVDQPNLRSLHLIGPSLTNKGLQTIEKMTQLKSFYIDDCELSDAAWQSLLTARRDLHVHIDQLHPDRK
jgi:Leucine-rich repeat (LRR) protein